jgi:hypothetical protein
MRLAKITLAGKMVDQEGADVEKRGFIMQGATGKTDRQCDIIAVELNDFNKDR